MVSIFIWKYKSPVPGNLPWGCQLWETMALLVLGIKTYSSTTWPTHLDGKNFRYRQAKEGDVCAIPTPGCCFREIRANWPFASYVRSPMWKSVLTGIVLLFFSSDILVPFIVGFQGSRPVRLLLDMIQLTTIIVIELTFWTVLPSSGRKTPLWPWQRAEALHREIPSQ